MGGTFLPLICFSLTTDLITGVVCRFCSTSVTICTVSAKIMFLRMFPRLSSIGQSIRQSRPNLTPLIESTYTYLTYSCFYTSSISSSSKYPPFSFKLSVKIERSLILVTDLPRLPCQTAQFVSVHSTLLIKALQPHNLETLNIQSSAISERKRRTYKRSSVLSRCESASHTQTLTQASVHLTLDYVSPFILL